VIEDHYKRIKITRGGIA